MSGALLSPLSDSPDKPTFDPGCVNTEKLQANFDNAVNLGMLVAITGAHFSACLSASLKGTESASKINQVVEALGNISDALWLIDNFNTVYWWIKGNREGAFHTVGKVADTMRQALDGVSFVCKDLDSVVGTLGGVPVLGMVLASLRIVGSTCSLIHNVARYHEYRVAKRELKDLSTSTDEKINGLVTKYFSKEKNFKRLLKSDTDKKVAVLEDFLKKKVEDGKGTWLRIIDDINTLAMGIFAIAAFYCVGLEGLPQDVLCFYVYGYMTIILIDDLTKPKRKEDAVNPHDPLPI